MSGSGHKNVSTKNAVKAWVVWDEILMGILIDIVDAKIGNMEPPYVLAFQEEEFSRCHGSVHGPCPHYGGKEKGIDYGSGARDVIFCLLRKRTIPPVALCRGPAIEREED